MKILVTGTNGFVGSYIVAQLLADGHEVFASSRTGDLSSFNTDKNYRFIQVDFTDPFALHDAFEFVQPDVVIHSGAMSRPDDCERRQSDAFDTNVFGTVQLLLNAEAYKSFFIFLSTDFIFDGTKGMYKEEEAPSPLSYYGKTKMDAEEAVTEYQHGWAIVRTSFVYGRPMYGRGNFITMIAETIKTGVPFNVVSDQSRTPTYVGDLAKGIAAIVQQRAAGVYHIAGKNRLTPFEMAQAVAAYLNVQQHQCTPVTRETFQELAQRPLKGGLDISKAVNTLHYQPTSFADGLRLTLQ